MAELEQIIHLLLALSAMGMAVAMLSMITSMMASQKQVKPGMGAEENPVEASPAAYFKPAPSMPVSPSRLHLVVT